MTSCLSLFIPINQLTLLSAFAMVGGLCILAGGLRVWVRKRRLARTPTLKIQSAAHGRVEVHGVAAGPFTMVAPITGQPCFLYHTIAWRRRPGKGEWAKVADETLHLPFFLEDATGRLLVEPLAADLDLQHDFHEEYGASSFFSGGNADGKAAPPRVSTFLLRHNLGLNHDVRIEERLIKPGDFVFITGTLTENPGIELRSHAAHGDSPEPSPAGNVAPQPAKPEVIMLSGEAPPVATSDMSQQGKIAAALTRAGITRPEAWSAAGVPFQSVAVEDVASPVSASGADDVKPAASGFDLKPPLVLMKGANDPTFVISFRSHKESISRLAWKSTGMIWGGAAITLLGLYSLLSHIGMGWL